MVKQRLKRFVRCFRNQATSRMTEEIMSYFFFQGTWQRKTKANDLLEWQFVGGWMKTETDDKGLNTAVPGTLGLGAVDTIEKHGQLRV